MSRSRATDDAKAIWQAGVAAVNGRNLVREFLASRISLLHPGPMGTSGRVYVLAAGKAADAMASGLLDVVAANSDKRCFTRLAGTVLIPESDGYPATDKSTQTVLESLSGLEWHAVRPANENLPTPQAVKATQQVQRQINSLEEGDLLLALISGGGSSLLAAPRPPLTLADKLEAIRLLADNGADIRQLNTLRAALSSVKQGQLIARCRAGQIVTLVLSDIIGDPLHLIAGGPTVRYPVDWLAARDVLMRFDPHRNLVSPAIHQLLLDGEERNAVSNEVGIGNSTNEQLRFVIGNNEAAVAAARTAAQALGYHTRAAIDQDSPDANDRGRRMAAELATLPPGHCLISGGEPSVQLVARERRGSGGRNQQLVLSALAAMLEPNANSSAKDWCLLSAGTDGQDGTTSAAGAWINKRVLEQAAYGRPDVFRCLQCNDAWNYFRQNESLLVTGPTGTNVCDIRVTVCAPD